MEVEGAKEKYARIEGLVSEWRVELRVGGQGRRVQRSNIRRLLEWKGEGMESGGNGGKRQR